MHDNGYNGIMLHRSCDHAIVADNVAYGNVDAGLAIYESSFVEVYGNFFYDNKCEILLGVPGRESISSPIPRRHRPRVLSCRETRLLRR